MTEVKVEGKVTPEVLQTVYLDEIAGRLAEMTRRMMEAEAQGIIYPLNLPVTGVIQEIRCNPFWYSFTVFNDGPNPVYVDVNKDQNARLLVAPLNMGENLAVNFDKPRVKFLYAACAVGQTANIRIFATW